MIWNLTGGAEHVTDVSNASRTLLFSLATLQWDDELLELFGIPRNVLPRVAASSEVVGVTVLFGGEIPIAGNAGDQRAATFGQACFSPGMAKNTYGTGAFMLMNVGAAPQASDNRLLATAGWSLGSGAPAFMLEGSVFVAGAVVQWLRDGLALFARSCVCSHPMRCSDATAASETTRYDSHIRRPEPIDRTQARAGATAYAVLIDT